MQSRKEWRARRQRRRIVGSVECEKRREFFFEASAPFRSALSLFLPEIPRRIGKGALIREGVRAGPTYKKATFE